MISIALRHYLYDIGITILFDAIGSNFVTPMHKYLGRYWIAIDDENFVVAYGKCIQEEKTMIVLDDGESEFIIHTELFRLMPFSEGEMRLMELVRDEED